MMDNGRHSLIHKPRSWTTYHNGPDNFDSSDPYSSSCPFRLFGERFDEVDELQHVVGRQRRAPAQSLKAGEFLFEARTPFGVRTGLEANAGYQSWTETSIAAFVQPNANRRALTISQGSLSLP